MSKELKTQIRKVLRKGRPKGMDIMDWIKYKRWAKQILLGCKNVWKI